MAYHQGDPRGAALYLVETKDIGRLGATIHSIYSSGICVPQSKG